MIFTPLRLILDQESTSGWGIFVTILVIGVLWISHWLNKMMIQPNLTSDIAKESVLKLWQCLSLLFR